MSKIRVVVTGVNGFVGNHLARELVANDISVIGIGHDTNIANDIKDVVDEYYQQDLVASWPNIDNIDAVIHLASLAVVGPSFDNPQRYINNNSAMVTNLCEYYQKQDKKPRIIVVSSGTIYDAHQLMPIAESGQPGFTSPYSVSKVLNENQCAYYRNRGLDCIVVRPFNHIGPGQAQGFILPDFYKRLSDLSMDETVVEVGNINTRRDYTDVRDIVRAYVKLAVAPTLNDHLYNICSGRSLSGSQILDKLKVAVGREDVTFEINPDFVRPTDIEEITGDSSRLRNELNWQPEYDIDQTISDFIESTR